MEAPPPIPLYTEIVMGPQTVRSAAAPEINATGAPSALTLLAGILLLAKRRTSPK
jgi:hypothetical protein